MQQQISVVTLGVANLLRSQRFYGEGFGWKPVFDNEEVAFYQMKGFVLGTWLTAQLEKDMQVSELAGPGAVALAHNVASRDDVEPLMEQLVSAGGKLLRAADAPDHGGFRGYVADPDGHHWEIAWNPSWKIDSKGLVTFGV